MSVERVPRMLVICDTCGDDLEVNTPGVMAARVAAGVSGWHFAEGRLPGVGTKGQRQFDYCPKCWPESWHATR